MQPHNLGRLVEATLALLDEDREAPIQHFVNVANECVELVMTVSTGRENDLPGNFVGVVDVTTGGEIVERNHSCAISQDRVRRHLSGSVGATSG